MTTPMIADELDPIFHIKITRSCNDLCEKWAESQLTDPVAIARRQAILTRRRWDYYHPSAEARAAMEVFNLICSAQIEQAVSTPMDPRITRDALNRWLNGRDEERSILWLIEDKVIGEQDGKLGVIDQSGRKKEVPWPGWEGGDPKGIRYQHKDAMREVIFAILRAAYDRKIPVGILPPMIEEELADARRRGQVGLPAWVVAVFYNRWAQQAGYHPVGRMTANNRITELIAAGRLLLMRRPRTEFNPAAWNFRVHPARYAFPAPGLQGLARKVRSKVVAALPEARVHTDNELQCRRWEWRAMELESDRRPQLAIA